MTGSRKAELKTQAGWLKSANEVLSDRKLKSRMYVKWFSAQVSLMWWLLGVSCVRSSSDSRFKFTISREREETLRVRWQDVNAESKQSIQALMSKGRPGDSIPPFPRTLLRDLIKITSKQEMLRWWNRQALNFSQIIATEFIRLRQNLWSLLLSGHLTQSLPNDSLPVRFRGNSRKLSNLAPVIHHWHRPLLKFASSV